MNKENKLELIQKFEDLSSAFDDVPGLPAALLRYRPFPDAWSIVEQVVHCVDLDVASFHRYRWGITYPGTRVLSFDKTWVEKLQYEASDIGVCINIIKVIRTFMASHFRTIVDEDWSKYHYKLGEEREFNLEEALQLYVDHVDFHRKLIDRNIEMFRGSGAAGAGSE